MNRILFHNGVRYFNQDYDKQFDSIENHLKGYLKYILSNVPNGGGVLTGFLLSNNGSTFDIVHSNTYDEGVIVDRYGTFLYSSSGVSSIDLADTTAGAKNYITIKALETETNIDTSGGFTSSKRVSYADYQLYNTFKRVGYEVTVYTAAEWGVLTSEEKKEMVLIGVITAGSPPVDPDYTDVVHLGAVIRSSITDENVAANADIDPSKIGTIENIQDPTSNSNSWSGTPTDLEEYIWKITTQIKKILDTDIWDVDNPPSFGDIINVAPVYTVNIYSQGVMNFWFGSSLSDDQEGQTSGGWTCTYTGGVKTVYVPDNVAVLIKPDLDTNGALIPYTLYNRAVIGSKTQIHSVGDPTVKLGNSYAGFHYNNKSNMLVDEYTSNRFEVLSENTHDEDPYSPDYESQVVMSAGDTIAAFSKTPEVCKKYEISTINKNVREDVTIVTTSNGFDVSDNKNIYQDYQSFPVVDIDSDDFDTYEYDDSGTSRLLLVYIDGSDDIYIKGYSFNTTTNVYEQYFSAKKVNSAGNYSRPRLLKNDNWFVITAYDESDNNISVFINAISTNPWPAPTAESPVGGLSNGVKKFSVYLGNTISGGAFDGYARMYIAGLDTDEGDVITILSAYVKLAGINTAFGTRELRSITAASTDNVALAVDGTDIYVTYYSESGGLYCSYYDGSWQDVALDTSSSCGFYSELAVATDPSNSSQNVVYVVYNDDATRQRIKFGRINISGATLDESATILDNPVGQYNNLDFKMNTRNEYPDVSTELLQVFGWDSNNGLYTANALNTSSKTWMENNLTLNNNGKGVIGALLNDYIFGVYWDSITGHTYLLRLYYNFEINVNENIPTLGLTDIVVSNDFCENCRLYVNIDGNQKNVTTILSIANTVDSYMRVVIENSIAINGIDGNDKTFSDILEASIGYKNTITTNINKVIHSIIHPSIIKSVSKNFNECTKSWIRGRANGTPIDTVPIYSITSTGVTLENGGGIFKIDSSSNAITVTLPDAVENRGCIYRIKRMSESNLVTIETTGSQTIDDESSEDLQTTDLGIIVVSDGANWNMLGMNRSREPVYVKSTATTLDDGGGVFLINALQTTLPDATQNKGYVYRIKRYDTLLTLTIGTTGSQTIDTNSEEELIGSDLGITLVSDGSNWKVWGGGGGASVHVWDTITSAGGTLTTGGGVFLFNISAGGTVYMPAAADNVNQMFILKKVGGGDVTIERNGSTTDTIDGQTSVKMTVDNASLIIVCDGLNNQYKIAGFFREAPGDFTIGNDDTNCKMSRSTTLGSSSDRSGILFSGDIQATKVWAAVWNDFADFQKLDDVAIPGQVYYEDKHGARICRKRAQKGVLGICTDTFGSSVGINNRELQVPIAVAGFVLAHVDKEYESGTPLVNASNGKLTKAYWYDRLLWPERIIATYKRKEPAELWGTEKVHIHVDGRHWVKVR